MDYLEKVKGYAKRRKEIVKLRKSGLSWQAIADEMGISRQRAMQLHEAAVKK